MVDVVVFVAVVVMMQAKRAVLVLCFHFPAGKSRAFTHESFSAQVVGCADAAGF